MIVNHILKWSNYPAYRAFIGGIEDCKAVQTAYLMALLEANRHTAYGRDFCFGDIHSVEAFQDLVPLAEYSQIEPYIQRAMTGEEAVLTAEPIQLFELSSGSTSASKYIPYTKGLKADFMAGVQPWLYDLYTRFPKILKGKSYWSISPVNHDNRYTAGGTPIGFEEDTGYFGRLQTRLFDRVFAVPAQVKEIHDIEDFRYVTLYFLLKERHLGLISVWNPSFLSLLLDCFESHHWRLTEDLRKGHIRPPKGSVLPDSMIRGLKPMVSRALEIEKAVAAASIGSAGLYHRIWPSLTVVSAWDQGNSRKAAQGLMARLKGIRLQGKGLLATEGLITFPLEGIGHVVSYQSHFLEFVPADQGALPPARPLLVDQLEKGKRYTVLMTTRGGLYRYPLHDLVEVAGHYKGLPLLEFIGKTSMVSDYCGEKVNGYHVQTLLEASGDNFAFVGPAELDGRICYVLHTEGDRDGILSLAGHVEAGLMTNYHYAYARHLEQLGPLRVYQLEKGAEAGYYDLLSETMKLGDIKYQPLVKILNIYKQLPGAFLEEN